MLLRRRWSKVILGIVLLLALSAIALYEINEWWPGCNFARKFARDYGKPGGEPLIIAAAKAGCTGCVRTLLRHGVDPNIEDDIYGTPLVAAAQQGHYWTARLLLKRGARVNAGVGPGTALCQAMMSLNSENPDDDIIELLVSSGAALQWTGDADIPDYSVLDCLRHSDSGPSPSVEAKRFAHLVDHGFVDVFNKSPEQYQASVLMSLYDDEIKQLARHGAKLNLDVRERDGQTILTRLTKAPGRCGRIRLLVSEGAQYAPEDAEAVNRCIK
jgi:ankyrin repeat protein